MVLLSGTEEAGAVDAAALVLALGLHHVSSSRFKLAATADVLTAAPRMFAAKSIANSRTWQSNPEGSDGEGLGGPGGGGGGLLPQPAKGAESFRPSW